VSDRPPLSQPEDETVRVLDRGFWLVVAMAGVLGVLVLAALARGVLAPDGGGPQPGWTAPAAAAGESATPAAGSTTAGSSMAVDVASYLYPTPREAPSIELTDQDERPFSLSSFRGEPTLVFFGYTHCPDVCPATIGTMGLAMDAFGRGVHATFVTVDPERDTPTWLKEYVRYLPTGFVALTGTADRIRAAADAWGVRYARVESATPGAYSMSHTADVYLVDANGMLRARFPFGTEAPAITAVLREVVAATALAAPSAAASATAPATALAATPTPSATSAPAASIDVTVVSSSVWAGGPSPVILTLVSGGAPLNDPGLDPTVQLENALGELVGSPVQAVPVQPPGVETVSYVAELDVPSSGAWRIAVSATRGGTTVSGSSALLTVLDPGATTAIGTPAPTAHTPTLADVAGNSRAVTTDPAPDLRLSQTSTTDALAAGQAFVLVIDSTKFRVSPACGRAIIMARYLLDRWRDVGFIHLEPYRYSVITDTPVLDGSLDNPTLTDPAAAWGTGGAPWGPRSMPWVFVVDGHGIVRAKYQGVMGSADVDVIVSLIEQGG
jgi:protein SCO1/2